MATITLMGLLTYDPEVLNENFNLPTSLLSIKTKLLEHIVFECAELEIVISDPVWFGRMLDAWSTVMSPQWEYFLKWKLAQDETTTEDSKGGRKLTKKALEHRNSPLIQLPVRQIMMKVLQTFQTVLITRINIIHPNRELTVICRTLKMMGQFVILVRKVINTKKMRILFSTSKILIKF